MSHDIATLPNACCRALRAAGAQDHTRSEAARRSAHLARYSQRGRGITPRCERLKRTALRAEARARDLMAEAR